MTIILFCKIISIIYSPIIFMINLLFYASVAIRIDRTKKCNTLMIFIFE